MRIFGLGPIELAMCAIPLGILVIVMYSARSKSSPTPPQGASQMLPSPAWLSDPSSRHEFRYWDGAQWTASVSDQGVSQQDPISFVLAPPGPAESLTRAWSDGKLLVMHVNGPLPRRCLRTNQTEDLQDRQYTMRWRPEALIFLVLLGILPYLLAALVFTKTAVVTVPLSRETVQRFGRATTIAVLWVTIGAIAFFGSLGVQGQESGAWIALFAAAILVAGLVYAVVRPRLTPKRITDDYIWLAGVSPEYLAGLPNWSQR